MSRTGWSGSADGYSEKLSKGLADLSARNPQSFILPSEHRISSWAELYARGFGRLESLQLMPAPNGYFRISGNARLDREWEINGILRDFHLILHNGLAKLDLRALTTLASRGKRIPISLSDC